MRKVIATGDTLITGRPKNVTKVPDRSPTIVVNGRPQAMGRGAKKPKAERTSTPRPGLGRPR